MPEPRISCATITPAVIRQAHVGRRVSVPSTGMGRDIYHFSADKCVGALLPERMIKEGSTSFSFM